MTKIPLKDYQNGRKLSTDISLTDDQNKNGFKFENVGGRFQIELS